jgi:tripartite-type tricarboxylate transporter receptor subunit TctC
MSRALVIAAFAMALAGQDARAELLSKRPITIVIPYTPGASSDTFQRLVARKVTEETGQLIVVESRPGGGGTVGALAVKQAAPDGYTLFQANSGSHAANVTLFAPLPYDPLKDFQPITLMWSFPQLLAVPRESPAKSVLDLIAFGKSKPGGLSFGSQGNGSIGHIMGEMFKARAKADMVHVPYRGAGPAALDVATDRLDFMFISYASILPFMQSGKVRALAVGQATRLTALPDVPTMVEAGVPGFELAAWFGLVGPAGIPKAVLDKLHAAFARAVRDPQVARQFEEQGAEGVTNTPEEFAAFIAAETERQGNLVRTLGVRAD